MESINDKIEALSKINLEDFDIDILEVMHSEIQEKKNRLKDIEKKIDNLNKQKY